MASWIVRNVGGRTLIPFWLGSVDRNKEDTQPFKTLLPLQRYIDMSVIGNNIFYSAYGP